MDWGVDASGVMRFKIDVEGDQLGQKERLKLVRDIDREVPVRVVITLRTQEDGMTVDVQTRADRFFPDLA
jgi:hypothetical protein